MKSFKGTAIFTVLIVGFSIFSYFEFLKDKEEKAEEAKREKIFGEINEREIKKVSIKKGEEEIILEKTNGRWKTLVPVKDKGDPSAINSFIREFSEQKAQALIFEEGGMNIKDYGLETPLWSVEFTNKIDGTSALTVGSEKAFDGGYYFQKKGDGNIYITGSGLSSYLNKDANAFRSKVLFPNIRLVRSLRVVNQKANYKTIRLTQTQGQWTVTGQPSVRLDQQKVKDFVSFLRNIKADAIVSDKKSSDEIKKYRLNKPQVIVDMEYSPEGADSQDKKKSYWKFRVSSDKENTVYLRSSNTKSIYKAAKYKTQGLLKTLDDFRNKEYPFEFDLTQVEKLQLSNKGEAKILVKSAGAWTEPEGKKSADVKNVEKLLKGLRDLRVDQFTKKSKGIEKNQLILTDTANKDVFTIHWGDEFKKDGESFYPVKTNLSDESFALRTSKIDSLLETEIFKKPQTKKSPSDKSK